MRNLVALLFIGVASNSFSQTGSEILLFDLKSKKSEIILSNPKNITNHLGYDNQPSFNSDEPIIYYSSFNEEGRSDIKTYNYTSGVSSSLTKTSEREYSPTLTPDKQFISCIIQRDNGAQDLGKYPVKGGEPVVLINNLIVGYHKWIDKDRVLLFVLGEPQTLHVYNIKTKEDKILDTNIGRSLHQIPNKNAMSYIKKNAPDDWDIMQLNVETLATSKLIDAFPNREDLCWTPNGKIMMSDGSKIFFIDPRKDKEWKEIRIQSGKEFLKGITRLAVDKKGNKLAIVVAE